MFSVPSITRHGVDGRRVHLPHQGGEGLVGCLVGGEVLQGWHGAVGRLDGRGILIVPQVVAGAGEEGSHGVEHLPGGKGRLPESQGHQQGAAVEPLRVLGKVDLAVPHHGPEVRLQHRITLVVAPGLELAVVHIALQER